MSNIRRSAVLGELKNQEEGGFTPEAMIVAVANKKARKAAKGVPFNCFVLDRAAKDGDELQGFLTFLKTKQSHLPDNTRFQIIYQTLTGQNSKGIPLFHWSTADIRLKDGKFDFYLLDAANSLPAILKAAHSIHEQLPNATIRYSGISTQADGHNCATFSLDHAFRLAKIADLHDRLPSLEINSAEEIDIYQAFLSKTINEDVQKRFVKTKDKKEALGAAHHLHYIPSTNFPPDFGPLLRNAQHLFSIVDALRDKGQNFLKMKGNDEVEMRDYFIKRNVTQTPLGPDLLPTRQWNPTELKSNAIKIKRETIKKKSFAFLEAQDEKAYRTLIDNNRNYEERLFPKHSIESKDEKKVIRESKDAFFQMPSSSTSFLPFAVLSAEETKKINTVLSEKVISLIKNNSIKELKELSAIVTPFTHAPIIKEEDLIKMFSDFGRWIDRNKNIQMKQ